MPKRDAAEMRDRASLGAFRESLETEALSYAAQRLREVADRAEARLDKARPASQNDGGYVCDMCGEPGDGHKRDCAWGKGKPQCLCYCGADAITSDEAGEWACGRHIESPEIKRCARCDRPSGHATFVSVSDLCHRCEGPTL